MKLVAREQLQNSFYRCLPNEPTNQDYEDFLSSLTEGPFKIYAKLGKIRAIWTRIKAACRFLNIKITNFGVM